MNRYLKLLVRNSCIRKRYGEFKMVAKLY